MLGSKTVLYVEDSKLLHLSLFHNLRHSLEYHEQCTSVKLYYRLKPSCIWYGTRLISDFKTCITDL